MEPEHEPESGNLEVGTVQAAPPSFSPVTEDDQVHAIANTGTVDAELYITFLVKHGAPRRRHEPAPDCAVDTGIP